MASKTTLGLGRPTVLSRLLDIYFYLSLGFATLALATLMGTWVILDYFRPLHKRQNKWSNRVPTRLVGAFCIAIAVYFVRGQPLLRLVGGMLCGWVIVFTIGMIEMHIPNIPLDNDEYERFW